MLLRLVIYVAVLLVIYHVLKRLLGLGLSRIARNRHVRVDIIEVGLLVTKGIHVHLAKGPVEHIRVTEVSFGRTKSAKKLVKGVARFWSTFRLKLPLTIRGLQIELREGSDLPAWAARLPKKPIQVKPQKAALNELDVCRLPEKPKKVKPPKAALNELEERSRSVSRNLLVALTARVAFFLLPFLPLRVKNLSVISKGKGFAAEVGRIELLCSSSLAQLASSLTATLSVLPVSASLLSSTPSDAAEPAAAEGLELRESTSRLPLLELSGLELSTTVQLVGQSAVGCKLVSLRLGDAVIMATQAALAALLAMQPAVPKAKKALKNPKPGKQPLLAKLPADLGFLGDLVPEAVDVGLKQVSCHFMGGGTGAQHGLEAFAEANALQLKAQKPVRVKRFRRQRQQQNAEAQSLYTVDFTTGILQTGAGVAGLRPAAALECQSITSQLRFMKPGEQKQEQERRAASAGLDDADGMAAVPRIPLTITANVELSRLVTSCCAETLWPFPEAIADLQKALAPARKAPAAPPRLAAADRWRSAARSATLQGVAGESVPEAPAAVGTDTDGGEAPPGSMHRAGSARMPGLSINPSLIPGPCSDPEGGVSAATSPEDPDLDKLQGDRTPTGSQAGSAASNTAAQAARDAWASSFRSDPAAKQAVERWGSRRSFGSRSAGGDKRSLGLRLAPSMSVSSNAERLMGRLSAGRAQSAALSEVADEADHLPKAVVVIEWEACVRMDASSRLQLLAAGGEEQLVVGFDSLAVSGKSLTKLHLSTSGIVKPERPREEPSSPMHGAGRRHSDDNDLDLLARQGLFTAAFTVQNISFNVRASRNEGAMEPRMLKLVGANLFIVSMQPAEKELQSSDDDHAGPLHIEGEVRTQALSVAADAAMLQAIATVAAAVLPPADLQLPMLRKPSRSATPGSSRRPRSLKGPPAMLLSNAVIAFEDCSVSYSTHVTVPERFCKPGTDPQGTCSMCLGLTRVAAAVKPLDKQADIELCDLTLTCSEQPADVPGASPFSTPKSQCVSPSAPLLALQDILATVRLQDAPHPSLPTPAPATEGTPGQPEHEQAAQGAASGGRNPAGAKPKGREEGGQGAKHAAVSPSAKRTMPCRKLVKAGLELDGLRAVFDTEAVFAACQIAADAVAMHEKLAPQPPCVAQAQQASTAVGPLPSLGTPRQDLKQRESPGAAPSKKTGLSLKSSTYEVEVSARLSNLQGEARLSELVCWGVRVQTVSAALGPRCAVVEHAVLSLNSAELISLGAAVVTASVPGVLEEPPPGNSAWLIFPRAEGAEDLGRALTGAILPPSARAEPFPERTPDFDESSLLESASLMNSMVTDMDAEDETRTLSRQGTSLSSRWRDIADMAAADARDSSPLKGVDDSGPLPPLQTPQRPFGSGLEGLPAAYKRAGLGFWAKESPAEAPPKDFCTKEERPAASPQPAAAVLEAWLSGATVSLPFDQDPGTAERFTELWAKAFKEALSEHLKDVKARLPKKERKVKEGTKSEQALVEARVYLDGALFKMDHHPMEAWFAVHGPLLQNGAAKDSLWHRVLSALAPPAAGDIARGMVQKSGNAKIVMRHAFRNFKSQCNNVKTEETRTTDQGALMHVLATTVEALVVVCGHGEASEEAALAHITAVDPPSAKVQLKEVQMLHMDAAVGPVSVMFSGAKEPIAAAGQTAVFGKLAVARQATAAPETYTRRLLVGRCRDVEIEVALKGSRALIKVFTDLHASVEDIQSWFSVGLEPVIGLLTQAGKRLSPSDPDKSRAPSVTLPVWDMMRMLWRGQIGLTARRFEFCMSKAPRPDVSASTERLQVMASYARVRLSFGAPLLVALCGVKSTAYRAAGLDHTPGALFALPLVDFPAGFIKAFIDWELPRGRHQDDHYLHPAVPLGGGQKQKPIDVVAEYKCSAINANLKATIGQLSEIEPLVAASNVCLGAREEDAWAAGQLAASDSASEGGAAADRVMAYLGDHQVAFFKGFIDTAKAPPPWLRMVNKRGTFFLPLDPRRTPSASLPKLLKRFTIDVAATPLSVVHYTVDLDNASCGLTFSADRVAYSGNLLLNHPAPGQLKPGMSAITRKRELARTTTVSMLTDVRAVKGRFHWGDSTAWRTPGGNVQEEQDRLMSLMDTGAALATATGVAGKRGGEGEPVAGLRGGPEGVAREAAAAQAGEEAFILSIASCTVHEERQDPATLTATLEQQRPLRVLVEDCRVMIDVEARNAIIAMVMHLISAFKMPARPRTPQENAVEPATPMARPLSGPRRHRAPAMMSLAPSASLEAGGNLLRTLLKQHMSAEGSGQTASIAEGINEGDEGEPDATSADTELLTSPSRRVTEESAVSSMLGEDEGEEEMSRRANGLRSRNSRTLSESGGSRDLEDDAQEAMQEMLGAQEWHQEIREQTRRDEEVELRRGTVKWEVEVSLLQINLCSNTAAGRFLLAAQKCQLSGSELPSSQRKALCIDMQEVQGHIAKTDIDPGASPAWLAIESDLLCSTPGSGVVLKRVFKPFDWNLRIYNSAAIANATPNGTQPLLSRSKSYMYGSTSGAAAGSGGDEVRVTVPEIAVSMDAQEFQILQDVAAHLAAEQVPTVEGIGRDSALLYEAESEEVVIARDTFATLRQYLVTLQEETLLVGYSTSAGGPRARKLQRLKSSFRASSGTSRFSTVQLIQQIQVGAGPEGLDGFSQSLQDALQDMKSGSGDDASNQVLVLRWGAEQLEGARQALNAARAALKKLKAIEKKRKQKLERASRLTVEFDGVTWALCHDRTPFIEMALTGISLTNLRNRDQSGNSKLVIQSLTVRDATGALGAAAGTEAGMVLTPWNPDESWTHDALVQVNAVLGPATRTHTIYEHIEVVVHPLGVHLTEAVATAFWEYFFPKEKTGDDEQASKRRETWRKNMDGKLRSKRSSAASEAGVILPAHDLSGLKLGRPDGSKSAVTTPQVTSIGAGPGRPFSASEVHRRGPFWDGSTAAELLKQGQKVPEKPSPGRSALGESFSDRDDLDLDEALLQAAAEKKAVSREKSKLEVEARKSLFVHVRLNRVHCRVTYQGYPVNIKDFKVLLDKRVYHNLEGQWRDLFNRLKWDTVKSALKSVAGLQGRKFKELMPGSSAEHGSSAKGSSAAQLKSWLSGLGKIGKVEIEEAKVRERERAHKQRMLLGKPQRSSAAALRHSATAVGLLPTVPSAGSEEGLPKDARRSESALGLQKTVHGSFTNLQQGRLPSPRSDGEGIGGGRPPKGILRSAGSARSSDLMSHMISPGMSADAELPGGMPITHGGGMARSGNTSGQLSSQAGSSQLNSMRSGDLEGSLEPPASVFAPQSRSQQRTVPVADLQHLLGVSQPNRSANVQSGFSSALMPRPADAKEAEVRSNSASSGPHPKSVRFGDAVAAAEADPESRNAASLDEPTDTDFENAQELKVGSRTLDNMLRSGRFALVAGAGGFKGALSAPAPIGPSTNPSPGSPLPLPLSPISEAFSSSQTWPPGACSPRHAGTQSSPRTPYGKDSSDQGSPEAKPDEAAGVGRRGDADRAPAVIETNVTRSGHLHCEDIPRHQKSGDEHDGSAPGSQEGAVADELSGKPAESKVATDSVRLDTAYPRVTGTSAAPLRSPFCSDDSGPPTPRQRAAPPEAAQAAQHARSSPGPQANAGIAQGAFKQVAERPSNSMSPQKAAESGTAVADSSPSASAGASRSIASEGLLANSLQEESPPAAPAAPQMPSWLLAELRSPSKRGMQDDGAVPRNVSASGNSEPGPAYYGYGSLGHASRNREAAGPDRPGSAPDELSPQGPRSSIGTPRHGSLRSHGSAHSGEPGLRLEDVQGGPSGAPRHARQESSSSGEPGLKLEDLLAQPGSGSTCDDAPEDAEASEPSEGSLARGARRAWPAAPMDGSRHSMAELRAKAEAELLKASANMATFRASANKTGKQASKLFGKAGNMLKDPFKKDGKGVGMGAS